MNGILEMKGFHGTFHQLYHSSQDMAPNDTNDTADDVIGSMAASDNHTCSSGNGASSDILVVSL